MFGEEVRLFEGLLDLISKWKPKGDYEDEKFYKKDLFNYLKALQDKGTLMKEHVIKTEAGETRADIRVSHVAIEIKRKLNRKADRERAQGQITNMLKEFEYVIVVIVGKNEKEAVDLFVHSVSDLTNRNDIFGKQRNLKIIIVGKRNQKNEPDDGFGGFLMPTPRGR